MQQNPSSDPLSYPCKEPNDLTPEENETLRKLAESKRRALLESNKIAEILTHTVKPPELDGRVHRPN
jgi:hypothetical protein